MAGEIGKFIARELGSAAFHAGFSMGSALERRMYSDNRSPELELECDHCGSEKGWAVAKVELVKLFLERHRRICSEIGFRCGIDAFHHAVVILFICEHCRRGSPVHVTFEYEQKGVCVTKGYPVGELAPSEHQLIYSFIVQPLPYSQVNTIVDGMNWPASAYDFLVRNCQHWARQFVEILQSATARNVPRRPFKIMQVDIVVQGTEEVLRHNVVVMKFSISMQPLRRVRIKQMVDKALEQTGLKEVYKWWQ